MNRQSESQFRQLKMQVLRKVTQCLQLAEAYFQRPFPIPIINYQVRGLKAGVAYLQENEIRLNRTLLLENREEFIRQVVPHELAHLIAYQLFGQIKPHGIEWKTIMINVFQLEPHIYHQFDTKNIMKHRFLYECQCGTHHLSRRRHDNCQNKGISYFCKNCKGKLIYK
ncbi:hypothetical protein I926_02920 [Pasteurella multocida subsp. multocida OH4807]|nr:hypothetical protein I926_02920 [Pasteurella multocida subsp. multocida OH4807]